jgi:hypothetical protein
MGASLPGLCGLVLGGKLMQPLLRLPSRLLPLPPSQLDSMDRESRTLPTATRAQLDTKIRSYRTTMSAWDVCLRVCSPKPLPLLLLAAAVACACVRACGVFERHLTHLLPLLLLLVALVWHGRASWNHHRAWEGH